MQIKRPGIQIKVCIGILFLHFSSKTYGVGTQKNRLNETVPRAPKTHVQING